MGLILQRASVHLSTLWPLITPHPWASSDAILEKKKKRNSNIIAFIFVYKELHIHFSHVNC